MLVASFEIHVRLKRLLVAAQLAALRDRRPRRRAGIDPDVERVQRFGGRLAAVPVSWLQGGPEVRARSFEPDVRAVLLKQVGGVADDLGIKNGSALRVVERGNRYTPAPLAGDAPVGTRLDRAFDAVDAPFGNPFDLVDGSQSARAKGVSGAARR